MKENLLPDIESEIQFQRFEAQIKTKKTGIANAGENGALTASRIQKAENLCINCYQSVALMWRVILQMFHLHEFPGNYDAKD